MDCLAIAFGTVHGIYLKEPQLDLDRIRQVYSEINIPLVMHGGSGVSESDYNTAIEAGMQKCTITHMQTKPVRQQSRKP